MVSEDYIYELVRLDGTIGTQKVFLREYLESVRIKNIITTKLPQLHHLPKC